MEASLGRLAARAVAGRRLGIAIDSSLFSCFCSWLPGALGSPYAVLLAAGGLLELPRPPNGRPVASLLAGLPSLRVRLELALGLAFAVGLLLVRAFFASSRPTRTANGMPEHLESRRNTWRPADPEVRYLAVLSEHIRLPLLLSSFIALRGRAPARLRLALLRSTSARGSPGWSRSRIPLLLQPPHSMPTCAELLLLAALILVFLAERLAGPAAGCRRLFVSCAACAKNEASPSWPAAGLLPSGQLALARLRPTLARGCICCSARFQSAAQRAVQAGPGPRPDPLFAQKISQALPKSPIPPATARSPSTLDRSAQSRDTRSHPLLLLAILAFACVSASFQRAAGAALRRPRAAIRRRRYTRLPGSSVRPWKALRPALARLPAGDLHAARQSRDRTAGPPR